MANFDIPEKLIEMLRERRVIPFIGAGFSSAVGLPNWEDLLSQIPKEIPDCISYEEITKYCNDPLQIAEYFLLKCGKSIGPLRYSISNALHTSANPVLSGAHVELVNLGALQIYTTNFDDLIEKTYKLLLESSEVIALPRDVATAHGTKVQIVKYHGDLKHEATLVITESSYYSRLDFESPMDLKFRSDLLGKSVLFMGYSFRDINIRVIWFKLMQMMKDIPPSDRLTSYIVRLGKNPILEALYEDVGIKTIVLDPESNAKSHEEKHELLAEFMFDLCCKASTEDKIIGTNKPMFLSSYLIDKIDKQLNILKEKLARSPRPRYFIDPLARTEPIEYSLMMAARRRIPNEFKEKIIKILLELSNPSFKKTLSSTCELALAIAKHFGASRAITLSISRGLRQINTRDIILNNANLPWNIIWKSKIMPEEAEFLLNEFKNEIKYQKEQIEEGGDTPDYDIAYLADIVKRIQQAEIIDELHADIIKKAGTLLKQASSLYESIGSMTSMKGQAPDVEEIISEIDESIEQRKVEEEPEPDEEQDDIPF